MNGVFDLGSSLPEVVLRTAIVFVVLVFAIRLLGRNEVAQLTLPDLIAVFLLANAVQNAMVGENTSVIGGLAAAFTIILLAALAHRIERRSPRAQRLLEGEPVMVVHEGQVYVRALQRAGLTANDLSVALRKSGLEVPAQAKSVVRETDGSISVVPWPERPDSPEGRDTPDRGDTPDGRGVATSNAGGDGSD